MHVGMLKARTISVILWRSNLYWILQDRYFQRKKKICPDTKHKCGHSIPNINDLACDLYLSTIS